MYVTGYLGFVFQMIILVAFGKQETNLQPFNSSNELHVEQNRKIGKNVVIKNNC